MHAVTRCVCVGYRDLIIADSASFVRAVDASWTSDFEVHRLVGVRYHQDVDIDAQYLFDALLGANGCLL